MEHELLHAVLAHPSRAAAHLGVASHPETAALFGVACDLVVNQLLSAGPPLPGAITLALLPDEHRVPGLTADEYFTLLKHLYAQGLLPNLHLCLGPDCRKSKCRGPASGHPWGGVSLSEAQLTQAGFEPLVRETALRCSSKAYGRLPAGVRSAVQVILDAYEPTLDWRRVLRMFSASSRRTRVRATLRTPSRRYHTFPGIRIARGQRLAVCVDTSGSIDSKTLAGFFAEVHQIWRAGAEVVVFEVDAEVQRTWQYRGTPPTIATGRGGTCFEPGLRAVREAVPRFDACVYLTDGEGPKPDTSPGVPLLWLVTRAGTMGSHLAYGQSVRMRDVDPHAGQTVQ
jgi:predicted metal-dependent peptidase